LFHPEFYKVAVSNSGCHDNRMDKLWWNEQWMGWPLGPQYSASSNTDHAKNLQGHLQLVVPEMDTNVDPSSTMQVVNALVQAGKEFELVVIPAPTTAPAVRLPPASATTSLCGTCAEWSRPTGTPFPSPPRAETIWTRRWCGSTAKRGELPCDKAALSALDIPHTRRRQALHRSGVSRRTVAG
jgi:hypothetical protein